MHSKKEYRFDTEAEAQSYVDKVKSYDDPSADTYVLGPIYMDEDKTFHNMPWAKTGKNYWLVSVEIYR